MPKAKIINKCLLHLCFFPLFLSFFSLAISLWLWSQFIITITMDTIFFGTDIWLPFSVMWLLQWWLPPPPSAINRWISSMTIERWCDASLAVAVPVAGAATAVETVFYTTTITVTVTTIPLSSSSSNNSTLPNSNSVSPEPVPGVKVSIATITGNDADHRVYISVQPPQCRISPKPSWP